jgi:hypothetical protein
MAIARLPMNLRAHGFCGLAAVGAMLLGTFIFQQPAFAANNGAKIIEEVDEAANLLEYFNKYPCSTLSTNKTYVANCTTYYDDLYGTVNAFHTKLKAGTLTVAYDVDVENDLVAYITDLDNTLKQMGYKYTPPANPSGSAAFAIVPDDGDSSGCTWCDKGAIAGGLLCAALTKGALQLCFGLAFVAYSACVYEECLAPDDPPDDDCNIDPY